MRARHLAFAVVVALAASACPQQHQVMTLYSIGGKVSGLLGTDLVLQNGGGDDLLVQKNGTFTFATKMAKYTEYSVTVFQQPSTPAQTCVVTNGGGIVGTDVTDVVVTCTSKILNVGGTVTGLVGAGLVLQSDAGDEVSVAASATTFAFQFPSGGHYSIGVKTQPVKPSQTCAVTNFEGTVANADVTDLVVTCTTNTYPVGGTVTGLVGTGLVLANGAGDELPVDATATSYAFTLKSGAAYAITIKTQPSNPGQTCTVANASGTVDDAKIDDASITCSTNTYAVGGNISGLVGYGLVLQNNAGGDLTIASGATTYSFTVPNGSAYAVTVKTQPTNPRQTCIVANATGTVGSADVLDVVITCVTDTYAVGGTIVGLVGSGLILQNNAGQDLSVAANQAVYAFQVPSGGSYAFTVKTQPSSPSQTCTIANPIGTVGILPVTNATITCTTNTYSVGGTITGLAGSGLVLQNNGSGDMAIVPTANNYAFPAMQSGATYAITVKNQPTNPEQNCVVVNPSGTVGSASVTSANITCTTKNFLVGGQVSGLAGPGLELQNNGGSTKVILAADTSYFFSVASSATWNISVKTQPSTPQQTCIVSHNFGTVGAADVTDVNVTCQTSAYSVGGTVQGYAGTGLVLQNGLGNDYTVLKGATSYVGYSVSSGSTYNISVKTQPTNPWQTCTVANGNGTVTGANVTNVNVTCTTNTYAVSGTISGYTGSGLKLANPGSTDLSLSSGATTFSFTVASGSAYAITVKTQPSSPTQNCVVANGSGTVLGAAIGGVTVTCGTNAFLVGGHITGLVGSGLLLANPGSTDLSITAGTTIYSGFLVASGSTYNVSVKAQPTNPWQTCTIVGNTGTVAGADVTTVNITCTTNTYKVGGAITGLSGTGLKLQNNYSNDLLVTGSTYSFNVTSGTNYLITVLTQPSNPTQTCTVTNGGGPVLGADITATISCATNSYNVGGPVTGLSGTGLVLQTPGAADLPVLPAAPAYHFLLSSGTAYTITVKTQPNLPTQTCSVTSGSGTVGGIDINSAAVTCTTSSYTVGGTMSGIVGPSSVVLHNGVDDLTVNGNGSFTFPTKVLSNATYAVTVKTPPANHACAVTAGSGTVTNANVTNVVVTCAWNTVILLAGSSGSTGHLAAAYSDGGSWASTRLSGTTSLGAGLTITGNGIGVGLIQSLSDNLLKYTIWDGSSWSPLASIGSTVFTRAQPSISGSVGTPSAQAVYHGSDWQFYAETYNALWTFGGGVGSPQLFGPVPPVIVGRGNDATVAFVDGSTTPLNMIGVVDHVGGAWGSSAHINNSVVNSGIRPAIVTLPSGPELLAVWQGSCSAHCCSASVSGCASNNQLRFASRTGGAWSTPADINYAWSDDPVALVSLPNGDAIVAWRAADFSGNRPLTVNRFDHATKTWAGTPAYLPHTLVGSPALARGLGGATAAEVAFVGVDGYAYHCRLVTGSTTTCQGSGSGPNQIGADVNFVSLATAP